MELTKAEVRALSEHRCFGCKWSQIDPFDWGLRCCNGDSEHCTDYCPEDGCEQYDGERTCGDCKHCYYFGDYSQNVCFHPKALHHACPTEPCRLFEAAKLVEE
jgi:hypothetical protein